MLNLSFLGPPLVATKNHFLGVDQKWIDKVFSEVRLHVDAQNLFVITPYTGVDPETDSYTAAYPNIKTYTVGARFTFK